MRPRVAFVIASHSDLLARGVVELAGQMAPDVRLFAAGGTDAGGLGTSYDRIEHAIGEALQAAPDAIVLTDLGSATLTVESVIDMADEPERIHFVDTALVEGAVAAAVAAQQGEEWRNVGEAARGAAEAFLRPGGGEPAQPAAEGPGEPAAEQVDAVVADAAGLHARPAAMLARKAAGYDAEITLNGADATSVLEVMALGVRRGDAVHLRASGPDAARALAELREAIEAGFDPH